MHSPHFSRPPRDRHTARLVRRPAAPSPDATERLRRAARFLCAEARMGDPRIEPLLASLERKWLALPAAEALPVVPGRRAHVWKRLVALCLEEFYAAPEPHPAGHAREN